jgi:hypothetical protein
MARAGSWRWNGSMFRRVLATALWAYFGWYLAAHLAAVTGVPSSLAVIGGVAMGALALVDFPGRLRRTPPIAEANAR